MPDSLHSNLPKLEVLADGSIFSTGDITKRDLFKLHFRLDQTCLPITALRLEVLPDERLPAGGPGRAYYEGRKGDFFLSELVARVDSQLRHFSSASHDYGKIAVGSGDAKAENVLDGDGSTGWSTALGEGQPHQLILNFDKPIRDGAELEIELLFERHFAASLGRFRFSAAAYDEPLAVTGLPVEIEALLAQPDSQLSDDDRLQLRRYFLNVTPLLADQRKAIEQLRQQLPAFATTMVMQERPADNPRVTYRHHRGEYLSLREQVAPGLPEFLAAQSQHLPTNRLQLARWLVSNDNPLVGRVTVNRAWQAFFGVGLHRTSEDFGTQSDPPTHPELLDWLACEFVAQGWSMKRLHRLIVTSETYRQSSVGTAECIQSDPHNEQLGRGPRFRVDAETVRDIMLRASGLLSGKMYGPGVRPPQPESVTAVAYGSPPWTVSTGEDRYRRSLYTFAKRTAPFAAYACFDAPSGETCVARRDRSNTPLQALTLLNDEMYLEMARHLAKLATDQGDSEGDVAQTIFRRLLTRPMRADEREAILRFFHAQVARFQAGQLQSADVVGSSDADSELAAWTMVARALMNLDETITKS